MDLCIGIRILQLVYCQWANALNISVFNALSIGSDLVAAVLLVIFVGVKIHNDDFAKIVL